MEVSKKCKQCKELYPKASLSTRGLCTQCMLYNVTESIRQMRGHYGKYYDKWLAGCKRAAIYKKIE